MAGSYLAAVDDIYGAVKAGWDANAAAAVGGPADLLYEETSRGSTPADAKGAETPEDRPWGRATIRHDEGHLGSVSRPGRQIWTAGGFLFVQCFAPNHDGRGKRLSMALAEVAAAAVRGKHTPNGVWFRGVTIKEVGRDGPLYQTNVVARFEWDMLA